MTDAAIMEQMTFAASDTTCESFKAHPFARSGQIARKCTSCGRDIQEHCITAVTPKDVMRVLESNEKVPSLISGTENNGLYMGGWIAAMNESFLRSANVGLVINTADGLESVFPKYRPGPLYEKISRVEQRQLEQRQLAWIDSEGQVVTAEEIAETTSAISDKLAEGMSVLVHCAQGRSRSGTIVVAYISKAQGVNVDDALKVVQGKRSMAQPNPHFMEQLRCLCLSS